MALPSNLGMLLLAVGLIVYGLGMFVALVLPSVLVAVWAIVTGILLLVGR